MESSHRQICILTVMNGTDDFVRDQAIRELRLCRNQPQAGKLGFISIAGGGIITIRKASFPYRISDWKAFTGYRCISLRLRPGGLIPIDNQGPWLTSTPWPGLWFNMNVQMSYSPIYTANRLHLGMSLIHSLEGHQDQLIRNVPEAYRADSAGLGRSSSYDLNSPVTDEVGNLTWVMHNCWRHYRYAMDDQI